ncbi:class I SAM-dependent methyltransferase [candidate division KSB1 bacterium]|nr:class I SAM-dependent methyltransferase [candidate division KSB1 bacterium]
MSNIDIHLKENQLQQDQYYNWARRDLLGLLPQAMKPENVLDVGCGNGATGELLKQEYGARCVTGIEILPTAAEQARRRLDTVITASADQPDLTFQNGHFDLIIFGDILEHLYDPWDVLSRYVDYLRPGGRLLASIPNVQHWATVMRLLGGRWIYREGGTLDRSHIRFFTRRTVLDLIQQAGMEIVKIKYGMGPECKIFNAATLGLMTNFLTFQFLILAQKHGK